MPNTAIIILNWNSPYDTIKCITSINKHIDTKHNIIVVDNASTDTSKELISACLLNTYGKTYELTYKNNTQINQQVQPDLLSSYRAIFIISDQNGGYGYGNNLGLMVSHQLKFDYAWIVNNDCELFEDALAPLLHTAYTHQSSFVGSIIKKPDDSIECYGGGRIFPWLGRTQLVKNKLAFDKSKFHYLMGASLLIKMNLLDNIGYISNDYFMYFEEIDWQFRAIQRGHTLAVSEKSRLIHKSGATTRGKTYFYYRSRSAIIFLRKYFRLYHLLFAVPSLVFSETFQHIRKPKVFLWVVGGVISGLLYKKPD